MTARSVLRGAAGRQVDCSLMMSVFCASAGCGRSNRVGSRKVFIGCWPHIKELPKGLPSLERRRAEQMEWSCRTPSTSLRGQEACQDFAIAFGEQAKQVAVRSR